MIMTLHHDRQGSASSAGALFPVVAKVMLRKVPFGVAYIPFKGTGSRYVGVLYNSHLMVLPHWTIWFV